MYIIVNEDFEDKALVANYFKIFLGHHYYILSLFDLCLGVEKILKATI